MRRFIATFIIISIYASMALGQEQQVRHRSGPRRQIATIVFAGLGGAILGLSTLSFYGRPQDQLSNIAIGFAVGVIAGTVYVTFRSATTRDYYDERPNPQGGLLIPSSRLASISTLKTEAVDVTDGAASATEDASLGGDDGASKWTWGPMITKLQTAPAQSTPVYGGQVQFQF